jgi:rRNA maturation RNase YbeY
LEINFFCEKIFFKIKEKTKIRKWLINISHDYGLLIGVINIIFTNNSEIFKINRKYLNHKYNTDIITFDYSNSKKISGDLFISIDTVKRNSRVYNVDFYTELHRVIVHGFLHLLKYTDSSASDKKIIREKENYFLKYLSKIK